MSDFWKEDYLIPIVNVTVNISGKPWDGSLSLHEIFKVDDQSLLNFISNYKLNLISPENIHDNEFEKFKTGLGTLLIFLKHLIMS